MNTLAAPKRITLFDRPGIAEVVRAISSTERGRVKFRASFWPARFYHPSEVGDSALPPEQVTVVGVDGITLLVIPINASAQIA
jgi:membrane protein implicated in regulation of membrane protease activity